MLRLIIIAALAYGGYVLVTSMMSSYKKAEKQSTGQVETAPVVTDLEGLPPKLQPSLDTAQAQGPASLKRWLDAYGRHVRDPKLGDIELDYAMALMRQNSALARETYRAVKARTPANSPLQPRLKRLAKTFE